MNNGSYYNIEEGKLIVAIIKKLTHECNLTAKQMGVIVLYAQQVPIIKKELQIQNNPALLGITVSTVGNENQHDILSRFNNHLQVNITKCVCYMFFMCFGVQMHFKVKSEK